MSIEGNQFITAHICYFYSLFTVWMRIKLRGENILIIFPLNTMYSCHQYQSLLNEDCVSPEHISDIPGNGITLKKTHQRTVLM